jgi:hypothetical protein
LHLQISYVEPGSHTPHPEAAVVLANVRLQLVPPAAEFEVALYHDAATMAAGAGPFEKRLPAPFTADEIAALQTQFAAAVYAVLAARPEFTGATIVE